MRRLVSSYYLCCYLALFLSVVGCSLGADTLTASLSLRDGETLDSAKGNFVLGFFYGGNRGSRYLGIWYYLDPETVVWVANRMNPVDDLSGSLMLSGDGNLVVLNRSKDPIWSTNLSRVLSDPVVRLLDTGNLVLGERSGVNSGVYLWQSFDYPSDTLLAGMKLGWDLRTGFERHLTSWKSSDDPAPGEYSCLFKDDGLLQGKVMKGSVVKFRTGPWNGLRLSGISSFFNISFFRPFIIYNETDAYFEFASLQEEVLSKMTMNASGVLQRLLRKKGSTSWDVMHSIPTDFCDIYGQCGANGFCTLNKDPSCECLPGFVPKSVEDWMMLNHTDGCVREFPLNCSNEGFRKLSSAKLPDLINFWLEKNTSLEECRVMCRNNCSCTAYANSDVRNGGSGCLMWFHDLLDIRELRADKYEQDIYIRLSALSLGGKKDQITVL